VAPIPQRNAEAPPQMIVTPAGNAVLAPAIGAAAGVIVRETLPCSPVRAIVLADRAPLALAQIRPPATPGFAGFSREKPAAFSGIEDASRRRVRVQHRNSLPDLRLIVVQHALDPDQFAERPGLERTATRRVRRIAVRNLGDVAKARGFEVSKQRRHEARARLGLGCLALPTHTQPCLDERANQPGPDGALMIGGIPLRGTSAKVGDVVR